MEKNNTNVTQAVESPDLSFAAPLMQVDEERAAAEREYQLKVNTEKTDKMFTFLRGVCASNPTGFKNTTVALGYAREMHAGQTRKTGEPYVIHPLSLTCDAVGMGILRDNLLAALLLHDVPEDLHIPVMDLPVDDSVKHTVELLTLRYDGLSKYDAKLAYYNKLATDLDAILGKGLDKRDNLSTMAAALPITSAIKNTVETKYMLLPRLKDAKAKWPEYSGPFHTIRKDLKGYVSVYAHYTGLNLYHEPPSEEILREIFNAKKKA